MESTVSSSLSLSFAQIKIVFQKSLDSKGISVVRIHDIYNLTIYYSVVYFFYQPADDGYAAERHITPHDIGHKEQQQNGTVRHTQVNIFYRDIFGSQIEYCRKQHITTDSLQVILNGILLLPYEMDRSMAMP